MNETLNNFNSFLLNSKFNVSKKITSKDYPFRPTSLTQSAKLIEKYIYEFSNGSKYINRYFFGLDLLPCMYFNNSENKNL